MPYKRIASWIGASPSSVHAWTKDTTLTEEQKSFNLRGPRGPQNPEVVRRRAESWAAKCRAARLASQNDGRQAAREGGPPASSRHACSFGRRGAKRRNTIQFTNSDPHMLALLSRRFLAEALAIGPDEIVMTLNVYTNNGMAIEEIERYWLDLLRVAVTPAVRKHTLNHLPTSSSGQATEQAPVWRGAPFESAAPGWCSTSMAPFRSTPASTSPPGWTEQSHGLCSCAIICLGPRSSMARASAF